MDVREHGAEVGCGLEEDLSLVQGFADELVLVCERTTGTGNEVSSSGSPKVELTNEATMRKRLTIVELKDGLRKGSTDSTWSAEDRVMQDRE